MKKGILQDNLHCLGVCAMHENWGIITSLQLCNPCFFIYHAVVQEQKSFPTRLDTNRSVHYMYMYFTTCKCCSDKYCMTALRVLSFDLLKIIVLLVFKFENEVMPDFCLSWMYMCLCTLANKDFQVINFFSGHLLMVWISTNIQC